MMKQPSYSVAVRTLGTGGEKYIRMLRSVHSQTVAPEKVMIYIAEGYTIPPFRIGKEEYVSVKKGMASQRALDYSEIESDYILMLDDDVELAPDAAELLLNSAVSEKADVIAADTFKNQEMTTKGKLKAAITSWATPRKNDSWAFKIRSNGTFSYNNKPERKAYLSQSAAGPASLWRKDSFLSIRFDHETWIDDFRFAYGEDLLLFFKAYANNLRLMVHYGADIKHLDGGEASGSFKKSAERLRVRAMMWYILWRRTQYDAGLPGRKRSISKFSFLCRASWEIALHVGLSAVSFSAAPLTNYIRGLQDGKKFVSSSTYKNLPPYIQK